MSPDRFEFPEDVQALLDKTKTAAGQAAKP